MFNKFQEGSGRVEKYFSYQKMFAVDFIYYRILSVLNIETDSIASLSERPIDRVVTLAIIYIETLKPDVVMLLVTS